MPDTTTVLSDTTIATTTPRPAKTYLYQPQKQLCQILQKLHNIKYVAVTPAKSTSTSAAKGQPETTTASTPTTTLARQQLLLAS
jgi:hypothetical protein